MILQSLLSLLITTISSPQSSISLSVWIAKSQIFYIPHSPALALVDARTVCLHIQFQISCTGVNVLFFFPALQCLFLHWFPDRNEHEMKTWVTLSFFSLQSLHKREHVLVINSVFHCVCSECLFLGSIYNALSFPF